MRKEQLLLLALLAALFRPASSQDHFEDDDISDECIVKTSIVLKKLSTCDSQKIQDDFRRNQLWTNVVKETIDEMIKQLRAEIKSQSDEVTNKLENKLEGAMKQAHDDKLEMKSSMDRNLQSVEANKKKIEVVTKQAHDDKLEMKSTMDRTLQSVEAIKKQIEVVMKQAHDDKLEMKASMDRNLQSVEENKKQIDDGMKQAHNDKLEMKASMDRNLQSVEANKKQMDDLLQVKSTMDRILQSDETKKKQMDDLLQGHDKVKSTMDRILQSVEENKKQMEELMMESIHGCQRFKASWPLNERNATLFFKAMGRTFYYNMTWVTWYESRDWCSSRGMHLATLKTAEETKQVANALNSKTSSPNYAFWVSASDIGRSSGQFHWADGTPVLESTWSSGRPYFHGANRETCAYINTGYEKLYDYPCSDTFYTLCEVPELLATCL